MKRPQFDSEIVFATPGAKPMINWLNWLLKSGLPCTVLLTSMLTNPVVGNTLQNSPINRTKLNEAILRQQTEQKDRQEDWKRQQEQIRQQRRQDQDLRIDQYQQWQRNQEQNLERARQQQQESQQRQNDLRQRQQQERRQRQDDLRQRQIIRTPRL